MSSRDLRAAVLVAALLPLAACYSLPGRLAGAPRLIGRALAPRLCAPSGEALPRIDWSFIDAAFLITCPNADGSNPRLDKAWRQIEQVGLADLTEVREFGTDNEDRVRGCYTSHITVLSEAEKRFADRDPSEPLNVLVLEDNLSISPRIAQPTLDAIAGFLGGDSGDARQQGATGQQQQQQRQQQQQQQQHSPVAI